MKPTKNTRETENKPYVFAMRIYLKDGHKPIADLAIMENGKVIGVNSIEYDDIAAREKYYINAYTLIWDERVMEDINCTFSGYVADILIRHLRIGEHISNGNAVLYKNGDIWQVHPEKEQNKALGDIAPGQIVKLGDREYIVLSHGKETTAVITKEFAKEVVFGENGDYTKSYVRDYCNGGFYNELVKAVGKDNIVKHTVRLIAEDGTGADKIVLDNVSILTTDLYRRYREFLHSYDDWWTATRFSDNYDRVCYVDSCGCLDWGTYNGCSRGVRPFCILNSSIIVED